MRASGPSALDRRRVLAGLAGGFLMPAGAARAGVPALADGIAEGRLTLARLGDSYVSDLSVAADDGFVLSLGRVLQRLDPAGRVTFAWDWDGAAYRVPFSHFVILGDAVLDLSAAAPRWRPAVQTINGEAGRVLTAESFDRLLAEADGKADVVIAGQTDLDLLRLPVFFRIGGDWVRFFVPADTRPYSEDWVFGARVEGLPLRHPRMTYLADTADGRLAHPEREVRDGRVRLPEHGMDYRSDLSLSRRGFDMSHVAAEIVYLGLPIAVGGETTHTLRAGAERLRFREIAVRELWPGGRLRTHMRLFVVPAGRQAAFPAAFLEFRPRNNFDTLGGEGLYVLRRT
ncbi:MAG: hypothetical protein AAF390_12475 [Pseudomonadota bacterium]